MLDQSLFRTAMSKLGAAVSVVTSDGVAGKCGTTVTAVSSVTDSPATLLVCINRNSWSNKTIKANGRICVNVLAHEDEEIARIFAGMAGVPAELRFDHVAHHQGTTGAPILTSALVAFDCRISEMVECGSHTIFLAEVVQIELGEDRAGLVYFDRHYHGVAPTAQRIA